MNFNNLIRDNSDHSARRINKKSAPLVLLFYDGYDRKAHPHLHGRLIANVKRLLRYVKRTAFGQQQRTGYYTSFLSLVRSLELIGCDVRINDFTTAQSYPEHPIGVAGFPTIINKVQHLRNPKIFGPGDSGMPDEALKLVTSDPTYKTVIHASEWICALYRPLIPQHIWPWFSGIDHEKYGAYANENKTFDFVIYDKIYWERSVYAPRVLDRVTSYLDSKNLKYAIIRYGAHNHATYIKSLKSSRALLFLSASETQGIAYQEALAANVPCLAWDEGDLMDQALKKHLPADATCTSVPYFDDRCGLTFKIENFEAVCDEFLSLLHRFRPRDYISENLSLKVAGTRYLEKYRSIMSSGENQ